MCWHRRHLGQRRSLWRCLHPQPTVWPLYCCATRTRPLNQTPPIHTAHPAPKPDATLPHTASPCDRRLPKRRQLAISNCPQPTHPCAGCVLPPHRMWILLQRMWILAAAVMSFIPDRGQSPQACGRVFPENGGKLAFGALGAMASPREEWKGRESQRSPPLCGHDVIAD